MEKCLNFLKQARDKFKSICYSIAASLRGNKSTYKCCHILKQIYLKISCKCSFIIKKVKYLFSIIYDHKINPNGVSIIIPTYKDNPYIDECINSIKKQNYPKNKIEIIIAVNGNDIEYYKKTEKKYSDSSYCKVIYTPKKGVSAARNLGIKFASKDYLTFLDDDDYITEGFLSELIKGLRKSVSISCGKMYEFDETVNTYNKENYINNVICNNSNTITTDLFSISSLFSSPWAKLFKTSMVKNIFVPFNEDINNTEDVLYFCENIGNISGSVYLCSKSSNEAYIRRLTDNSLSRPSSDKMFNFCITDRIKIIEKISKGMFNPSLSTEHKKFLMVKINSQTNFMLNYYNTLKGDERRLALEAIKSSDCFFLNKCKFADIEGIAFCHNFPPSCDASAYVASKRLPQIAEIENNPIKWDVITADMSNSRQLDALYNLYYVNYVINSKTVLPGKAYFNEKCQYSFGQMAFEFVKDRKVDVIYSRSHFAGSHVGAYLYKKQYPDVKWYAEFSDPLYKGTDNQVRKPTTEFKGEDAVFNTFWRDVEHMVYELADVVIYTNENQRKYMLDYLEDPALAEKIMARSLVMNHPILDNKFSNILNHNFKYDNTKINIGYFGTFYANRGHDDMLKLLNNPNVVLNIFTPQVDELYKQLGDFDIDKIRIFKPVSNLYFLNIASKLDYVYLNDVNFDGDLIPYLPSKYADYCTAGTKIIAKVKDGSPLSVMDSKYLIKVKEIDNRLVDNLTKQK